MILSPKNKIPIATAITIESGLNIVAYTGPFKCIAQAYTALLRNLPNIPVQMIEINDMSGLIFQRLLFFYAKKPTVEAKMVANML